MKTAAKNVPKSPQLVTLLESKQLLVCLGTGGVGKTTTSALLALAGAYLGRRAVVLTIDPAKRLADALGVGVLGGEPRKVPQECLWPGSKGSLHAMMLNPSETFDRMVGHLVKDEARRDRLLSHAVYQQISRGLAGVHEYMAVEKLHDLAHDDRFDLVVLDTPPSKNALDFLEAPGRAAKFFNEKITRFFVPVEGKPRLADRLFNAAQGAAMGLIGKVVGDEFIKEMADFMGAFQGLFRAFEERGIFVEKHLRGERAAYIIVTAPDPVRVEEGLEFAHRLREFKLRPSVFVVNRVRATPLGGVPTTAEAHDALIAANVPEHRRADLAAHLANHQANMAALSQRDAKAVEDLKRRSGGAEVLVAPDVLETPNDPAALKEVCRALLGFP